MNSRFFWREPWLCVTFLGGAERKQMRSTVALYVIGLIGLVGTLAAIMLGVPGLLIVIFGVIFGVSALLHRLASGQVKSVAHHVPSGASSRRT